MFDATTAVIQNPDPTQHKEATKQATDVLLSFQDRDPKTGNMVRQVMAIRFDCAAQKKIFCDRMEKITGILKQDGKGEPDLDTWAFIEDDDFDATGEQA